MKKFLIIAVLLSLPVMIFAGVGGTKHDFSTNGTTTCGGCHKPHNAGNLIPLWNDGNSATSTYNKYVSPTSTLDGTLDNSLNGASAVCMNCHDGMAEAINLNLAASATLSFTNAYANHPVSVTYADATDTGLVAKATATAAGVRLFTNKVECASCHNPHDNANTKFLRIAKGSICQTCHNK